jgi:hypothetical protein
MTHPDDRDDDEPESRGWKRPLLIVLATAPIGIALLFFAFMAQNEAAFDEARCPYREDGEVRLVRAGVRVRRDERTCQEGVAEHRWVLLRDGEPPVEIGRRRLEARFFEGQTLSVAEEEGRVRLEIRNPGMEPRVFRERRDAGPNATDAGA